MGAWEYHVITTSVRLTFKELWTARIKEGASGWELIEQLGREGWELVSAIPIQSAEDGTVSVAWAFKRPVPSAQ